MMNKYLLLLAILSFYTLGYSQNENLTHKKSDKHWQVNGTNLFMVPPTSFEHADYFKGFQHPEEPTTIIMTVEIPSAYSDVTADFKKENLANNDLKLRSTKDVKIGPYDGVLIELDQSANGVNLSKHILIYGDEEKSTMINGVFLKDSLHIGESIRQSLLSTYIDHDIAVNPRDFVLYHVNEHVGNLKFHSVVGNGMIFSRNTNTSTESEDRATLVTDMTVADAEIVDREKFILERLQMLTDQYQHIESMGINKVEIDNMTGYQIFASSDARPYEEMMHVVLFDDLGKYYTLSGTYHKESEKAKTDIHNVMNSFARKSK